MPLQHAYMPSQADIEPPQGRHYTSCEDSFSLRPSCPPGVDAHRSSGHPPASALQQPIVLGRYVVHHCIKRYCSSVSCRWRRLRRARAGPGAWAAWASACRCRACTRGTLVRRPTPKSLPCRVSACRCRACTRATLVRRPTPKSLPCRVSACRCRACTRYSGAAPFPHLRFLQGFGLPLSRLYARYFGAAPYFPKMLL